MSETRDDLREALARWLEPDVFAAEDAYQDRRVTVRKQYGVPLLPDFEDVGRMPAIAKARLRADAALAGPLASTLAQISALLSENAALRAERDEALQAASVEANERRRAHQEISALQERAERAEAALATAAADFDNIANSADPFDDAVGTQDHALLLSIEKLASEAGSAARKSLTPESQEKAGAR